MNSHRIHFDEGTLVEVEHISECFIKPKVEVEEAKQPYYLSPWDLMFLGFQYNQKGLLYMKPNIDDFSINELLETLKDSLSLTLVHFYPLAGQLATIVDHERHTSLVFVDCQKGPGVRFVHATFNARVSDILSQDDDCVQSALKYFFDHNSGELNYDGHDRPLLSVQITELADGIFIGCSMNHTLADGTSFWDFWNVWSEIQQGREMISNIPYHKRWVPDGYNLADHTRMPYIHRDEFIRMHTDRSERVLKSRFFHFSSQNVAKLKAKANEELLNSHAYGTQMQVSSFQALIALVWRSILRARGSNPDQFTTCTLAANNRNRLDPPLPKGYFGNALSVLKPTALVGKLLQHDVGWAAVLLHQDVVNLTEEVVHNFFSRWFESYSVISNLDWEDQDNNMVHVGSSPRFHVFENQFAGLGKPVAVRSGDANKYSGKITAFPTYEGGGSVDLEICLPRDSMNALELDPEFYGYVSN